MEINVHIVRFDGWGDAGQIAQGLVRTAQAVDAAGAQGLTLMDHWFQIAGAGEPTDPMLEGYTSLGFLAGQTQRATLGLLVTGVTYRHPGLLAKTIATLDVLSGGRAVLGIGAAWFEREHLGLGVPFPPLAERFERLEETLRIVSQMWSQDDGPFEGRHYRLAETICSPQPLHRVPVMVGGGGERKTLRLVALYADACNLIVGPDTTPQDVAAKLDVLRAHCAREGTSYDRIRRTVLWARPFDARADAAGFLAEIEQYAAVGVEEVHVAPMSGDPVGFVRGLGTHVVPRLREL
jgi:F420-dependent oxidoreductase-like protein